MSAENVPTGTNQRSDQSLAELVSALTSDISTLLRQELELARVEMKLEAIKVGRSVALLAVAGLLGVLTLGLVAWSASWALAEVVPTWLAYLIVALVTGAAATGVGLAGRQRLRQVDPVPRTTVETIREDKEWLSNQRR